MSSSDMAVQALLMRGTVRRAPVASTIFSHMSSVGGAGRDHKFVFLEEVVTLGLANLSNFDKLLRIYLQ